MSDTLSAFSGAPICVEVLPALSACRGKLLSEEASGKPVYAASFIRERRIVLETGLLKHPGLFQAILVHELFHFVWVRLGNPLRTSFAQLLETERNERAIGELGESSSASKDQVGGLKSLRLWKHYVCESFCDTASFLMAGSSAGNDQKLCKRFVNRRRKWFAEVAGESWKI